MVVKKLSCLSLKLPVLLNSKNNKINNKIMAENNDFIVNNSNYFNIDTNVYFKKLPINQIFDKTDSSTFVDDKEIKPFWTKKSDQISQLLWSPDQPNNINELYLY